MPSPTSKPKNYFLNESHELSVEAKGGGGRHVEYLGINWPQKANRLRTSLERVTRLTVSVMVVRLLPIYVKFRAFPFLSVMEASRPCELKLYFCWSLVVKVYVPLAVVKMLKMPGSLTNPPVPETGHEQRERLRKLGVIG
jgi:hypothetical protein